MPVTLDTSQYDLPAGALISTVASQDAPGTGSRLVAQLRDRVEKSRAEQKEWGHRFDQLYDRARQSDWNEPFLIQWVAALLEKQRAALELFHPMIEGLQRRAADYATRPDAELLGLCLATIDLILGWVAPYQTLSGKLLEVAAERRATAQKVRYAQPIEGEIDHGALSREFMARFPNIRAALAK
jgi:hypothetical protein